MRRNDLVEMAKAAGFSEKDVDRFISEKKRKEKEKRDKAKEKPRVRIFKGLNTNSM